MAVLLTLVLLAPAQEGPPEKVKKHYDMLLKRPAPGYLFDRFCNGWLDTATLDDLEKFLTARVQSQGTTADHLLLAYFHARQADSVKAIAQFRIALEKDPGSADAWYQKAVVEARTLEFRHGPDGSGESRGGQAPGGSGDHDPAVGSPAAHPQREA